MAARPKTALVTGASRGLGLEWTRQLRARGWRVFAACRAGAGAFRDADKERLLVPIALDVADAASVATLGPALEGVALDLLVNNAGTRPEACGPDKLIDAIDFDAMDVTLRTNVVGPCRVLAAALPALARAAAEANKFIVINTSSSLGSTAAVKGTRDDFKNLTGTDLAYRSSKAALNNATACAALELAERYPRQSIVIALDPGWVQTDMGTRGGLESPPLTVETSVSRQIAVVESLTVEDTGKYLDLDGAEVPW